MSDSINLEGLLTGLGTIGIAAVAVTRVLRTDKDWRVIIGVYKEQIDELKIQNTELRDELYRLRAEVDNLRREVKESQNNDDKSD